MFGKDFWRTVEASVGTIFLFLGIQVYLGGWINKYPWAFIIIGGILIYGIISRRLL